MATGTHYVDRIVLDTIWILKVTSDPNGSLEAPRGSVAYLSDGTAKYRNTSSGATGTTWVSA